MKNEVGKTGMKCITFGIFITQTPFFLRRTQTRTGTTFHKIYEEVRSSNGVIIILVIISF